MKRGYNDGGDVGSERADREGTLVQNVHKFRHAEKGSPRPSFAVPWQLKPELPNYLTGLPSTR